MRQLPDRVDLTDWVFHFTHPRQTDLDYWSLGSYCNYYDVDDRQAVYFDNQNIPIFSDTYFYQKENPFYYCNDSFGVLKRIISDGYIRSSWSFRGGKPTIYGKHSAVCFTEMPLYALINYGKAREDSSLVSSYGIALPKRDLFTMGGRQVIYGLSHHPKVSSNPRMVDEGSLPLSEQYRYVATTERVDWTHEREWRWKYDGLDLDDIPGIALWKLGKKPRPSRIILVVKTEIEEEEILDLIKEHLDDEGNIHGFEYDTNLLLNTSVVSLDRISNLDIESRTVRLEDLQPKGLARINLSDQTTISDAEILEIIREASEMGRIEGERWRDLMPRNSIGGHIMDVCGFAYVVSHEANSPIVNRMQKLGVIRLWMGTGYRVEIPGICGIGNQSLTVDEKAAEAAASYLTSRLGVKFYMTSRLD